MGKYRTLGTLFNRVFRNDLNANFSDVEADVKAVDSRVSNILANAEQPSEVVDARGTAPVLRDRLDGVDALLAETETKTNKNTNRFPSHQTLRIAHRGVEGLAPQNTLVSTDYAGMMGYDGVECDIQITADGQWVLFHDDTLDYLTTGTGYVKDKTVAELKTLTLENVQYISRYPNTRIPTLREYLDRCLKWGLIPFIEIKKYNTRTDFQSLFNVLKEYNMSDKAFIMATLSDLVHIKDNYEPNVKAVVFIDGSSTSINDVKVALPFSVVALPHTTVTEAIVKEINLADLQCLVWRNGNGLVDISDNLKKWGVHYTVGEAF